MPPVIPVAAYLLEAAYYALVGYAAWDIADKTADAIKNRDTYDETNEETTPKTFDIFPNVEQETDINGVPVDDSGIMKPFDASISQEKWMDNFAKKKKGSDKWGDESEHRKGARKSTERKHEKGEIKVVKKETIEDLIEENNIWNYLI